MFGDAFAKTVQPWKLQEGAVAVIKQALLEGTLLQCQVFCALRFLSLAREDSEKSEEQNIFDGNFVTFRALAESLVYCYFCQNDLANARVVLRNFGQVRICF